MNRDLIIFNWPIVSALMFFPTLVSFANYKGSIIPVLLALVVFGAFPAITYAIIRFARLDISLGYKVLWCMLFIWVWPLGTAIGYWAVLRKRGVVIEP